MTPDEPVRVTWGDAAGGPPEVKPTVLRLLVLGDFRAPREGTDALTEPPRRIAGADRKRRT